MTLAVGNHQDGACHGVRYRRAGALHGHGLAANLVHAHREAYAGHLAGAALMHGGRPEPDTNSTFPRRSSLKQAAGSAFGVRCRRPQRTRVKSFAAYYLGVVVRPRRTFDALMQDPRRLQFGAGALIVTGILYTWVYVLLYVGGAQPTTFRPWPAIPADDYYRYNRFLLAPSLLMCWLLASARSQRPGDPARHTGFCRLPVRLPSLQPVTSDPWGRRRRLHGRRFRQTDSGHRGVLIRPGKRAGALSINNRRCGRAIGPHAVL